MTMLGRDGIHHHGGDTHRARLAIAFAITAGIVVVEIIGAALTGSLALLVDAGHMLTDAGGLLMALAAASLSLRPPTSRRTWGFVRAEVLAATAQAAVLLAVGIFALTEGVQRLIAPPDVANWREAIRIRRRGDTRARCNQDSTPPMSSGRPPLLRRSPAARDSRPRSK